MRLTKREDHSKLTPFLPIFKKFSCHINHILRTITGEKYQPSMPASSYQAVLRSAQENGSCKDMACCEKNATTQIRVHRDVFLDIFNIILKILKFSEPPDHSKILVDYKVSSIVIQVKRRMSNDTLEK